MNTPPISLIYGRGICMPANKTVQVSVRLTEEDIRILDEYCEENDLKRAFVLRQALREYLDRHMDK